MLPRGSSFTVAAALLGVLLAYPNAATAQHHGGHGGAGGLPGGAGRPTGVDEKDTLKDFHQAMAVQATSPQIAEFQAVVKSVDTAKAELQAFLQQRDKQSSAAVSKASNSTLDQALENARSNTKKFVAGFSPIQKSGLKEATKRLDKADSSLEQEEKKLDQNLQILGPASEVGARVESLDKALTDFSNQQSALGREMGIVLATGQDLTFNLPAVKTAASIGRRTVQVTVSGQLSQTAAVAGQRTFKLDLMADLSDLQQNITELLRAQLNKTNPCGEQLAIRQAMLVPSAAASILTLQLHYERWACVRISGQTTPSELAESDGAVEMKLTLAMDQPPSGANSMNVLAEFRRIDANGMLADSLRSGDLGDDLRDKVAQSVLSAARPGADLTTALPLAVRGSANLQTARFQDAGVGRLSVVLQGQVQISNEQANALASQLNQTLSAQGTPQ